MDTPLTDARIKENEGDSYFMLEGLEKLCRTLERERAGLIDALATTNRALSDGIAKASEEIRQAYEDDRVRLQARVNELEEVIAGYSMHVLVPIDQRDEEEAYAEECRRAGKWALDLVTDWVMQGYYEPEEYNRALAILTPKEGHEIGTLRDREVLSPERSAALAEEEFQASHAVGIDQKAMDALRHARSVLAFLASEETRDGRRIVGYSHRAAAIERIDAVLAEGIPSQGQREEPTP